MFRLLLENFFTLLVGVFLRSHVCVSECVYVRVPFLICIGVNGLLHNFFSSFFGAFFFLLQIVFWGLFHFSFWASKNALWSEMVSDGKCATREGFLGKLFYERNFFSYFSRLPHDMMSVSIFNAIIRFYSPIWAIHCRLNTSIRLEHSLSTHWKSDKMKEKCFFIESIRQRKFFRFTPSAHELMSPKAL